MPEFKSSLRAVWWVVEDREERGAQSKVWQHFETKESSSVPLAEHKQLYFMHKNTTGGYLQKKPSLNIKEIFIFCLRSFQGAAESRSF